MKVGIITFNRAINYGAVLQSYALKNKIVSLGHKCEILNYCCKEVEKVASPFYIKSKSPKDILIFLMQIGMRITKNKKFRRFAENYLDVSDKVLTSENIGEYTKDFDLLITGSDQVWNYEITGLDENYFLKFAGKNTKTASYAASFGVSEIPDEYKEKYRELISNIQVLSVREEAGYKLVNELVGREAEISIDPVFLPEREQWKKITAPIQDSEDYILVYSINKADCYKIAEKVSERTGLKIVGLQTPMSNTVKCKAIRKESPEEFLSWLSNAKYIITDSFHGTAFSIIFNKQFVLCGGGEGTHRLSRQQTLLEKTGLTNRVCDLTSFEKLYEQIDYAQVNEKVAMLRKSATDYLDSLLERN